MNKRKQKKTITTTTSTTTADTSALESFCKDCGNIFKTDDMVTIEIKYQNLFVDEGRIEYCIDCWTKRGLKLSYVP